MIYNNYDEKKELVNRYIDELCAELMKGGKDEMSLQAWDFALDMILTEVKYKKDTVHNLLNHIYEKYREKTYQARHEGKPTLYDLMAEAGKEHLKDFEEVYKAEYEACKAIINKAKEVNNESQTN